MRFIKKLIVLLLLCTIGFFVGSKLTNPSITDGEVKTESLIPFEKIFKKQNTSIDSLHDVETYGEFIQLIAKSEDEVVEQYGRPERTDPSAYGYEWWIYKREDAYIQIGIENGMVETIFATGDNLSSEPFTIGSEYELLNEEYHFENEITYESGWKKYVFLLNKEEMRMKPMVQLTNDVYIICYFDQFTNKLSSVRLATIDVLLKQRLYDMEYRGTLPKHVDHSRETWESIEAGIEQQILDITNMYRKRHNLSTLQHDDIVAEVAFMHSKDMADRNYFSHNTPEGKTVGDRLQSEQVFYRVSAENIAYNLSDGPDVSEGWLNSEAHRQAVLEPTFTILGVGVYEKYYTQNFIFK